MKNKFLLSVLTGVALAGSVQAQTVINITGATAFRTGAINSINSAFGAGGNFTYGFSNTDQFGQPTSFTNGTNQIWRGNFPVLGQVIIRTSWNGSVEGIKALLTPNLANNADYLDSTLPPLPNGTVPASAAFQRNYGQNRVAAAADLAFSDVALSATPFSGTLSGGPVGVVTFTMVGNKTFRDDALGVSGLSAQQFRTLNRFGSVNLGFLRGNSTDTASVYLTGRNDGSGTRTVSLAETGYGISKAVTQYVAFDRSSTTNIASIVRVPPGGGFIADGTPQPDNASTVWSKNIDGNGGYSTGQDIRTDMAKTTTSTGVFTWFDADDEGDVDFSEITQTTAPAKLYLVTWLSTSDAFSARTATSTNPANSTALILGYNGVTLATLRDTNTSSTLLAADRGLVANGTYTAWSFEQLFHNNSPNQQQIFTELKTRLNVQSVVGGSGLTLGEMRVERTSDGDLVTPK